MFNLRFVKTINDKDTILIMGHKQSDYKITQISGFDSISVDVGTSQGFDQIGVSIDNMAVGERGLGIIGRIDNFKPAHTQALVSMFSPMTYLRLYFEEKYWIDVVVTETPTFSFTLRSVVFAVSLMAPYPYFKSVTENYYKLGGVRGGFTFPVRYTGTHAFGVQQEILFVNCYNGGNTKVDYIAEMICVSGSITGVTLRSATNQKYISVSTSFDAGDVVRIFRENNILRVTKTSMGITTDVFSDLDEDSDLFFIEIGDNVIKATPGSGDGKLEVAIRFYDTVTGVTYGI